MHTEIGGKTGSLFVIGTPIGNLEDITLRALKVLSTVDFILCEDTRKTKKLLTHYKIHKKVLSYHSYNEATKSQDIVQLLKEGKNIGLVSESGTPCISDPGVTLVKSALQNGIHVSPIPGPSALTASLSASGAGTDKILFIGFLPRIKSRRIKELLFIKNLNVTTVIYESPKRIIKTLTDISNFIPDRLIFLVREMTKIFEESFFGSPKEILTNISKESLRGEFTIILLQGNKSFAPDEKRLIKRASKMINKFKLSASDTAKLLSSESGIPKKRLYKMVSDMKAKWKDGNEE